MEGYIWEFKVSNNFLLKIIITLEETFPIINTNMVNYNIPSLLKLIFSINIYNWYVLRLGRYKNMD